MKASTDCLTTYLDLKYENKELHQTTVRACLAEQALTSDLPAWQNQVSQGVGYHGIVLDTAFQTIPKSADPVLLVSTRTVKHTEYKAERVYGIIWRMTMKQTDGVWRAVRIERLGKFD